MFIVKNRELFDTNRDYYEINTRHNMDIHTSQVNLAKYGNGVTHMAVRTYNALPNKLKEMSNYINKFKNKLKEFLYSNTFYTLDEFFKKQ
jgi:soluble lytic murein transglycosylase-like protein